MQHCVDRGTKVGSGVDQCAIEVKHQQPKGCGRDGAKGPEHLSTLHSAEKPLFEAESFPQRLKPNSLQGIYVRADARCGEVSRTLQGLRAAPFGRMSLSAACLVDA